MDRRECGLRGCAPLRYGEGLLAREAEKGRGHRDPGGVCAGLPLRLLGGFQRDNLAVAGGRGQMVVGRDARPGAPLAAIAAVEMPGRLEMFPGAPAVVLDGAHNPAGMRALVAALPGGRGRQPVVAVVSVLGDKDAAAMVGALAAVADIVTTRSSHARAVEADDLAAIARAHGRPSAAAAPAAALAATCAAAGTAGIVVVAGSLYLLADLRSRVAIGGPKPPAELARALKGIDTPRRSRPSWPRHQRDRSSCGPGVRSTSNGTDPFDSISELLRLGSVEPHHRPSRDLRGAALARPRLLDLPGRPPAHPVPGPVAGCVALSVLIPFLGTIIYLIVRPEDYLDEAR